MARVPVVVALLLALLAVAVPGASADGATTTTVQVKDQPFTFVLTDFCHGDAPMVLSFTANGVLHTTVGPDGATHETGTLTGPATLATVVGTFTGRFTVWFGANANNRSTASTVTASFTGAHAGTGERMEQHFVGHATVNANGELTVAFERGFCGGPSA